MKATWVFPVIAGLGLVVSSVSQVTSSSNAMTSSEITASVGACNLQVDGQSIQLQPGQGIEANHRWRNCEVYDGHPVVIFSDAPPATRIVLGS